MINFSIPDLMVTIICMTMIGLPAKTVINVVGGNNENDSRDQDPYMIIVKCFLQQQAGNTTAEQYNGEQLMMVFFISVVKRKHTNSKSQEYHEQFKIEIIYDVDAQYRQAADHQWQHCAMYSAGHGSGNSKCIIVDFEHPVKIWGTNIRILCNFVAIDINHTEFSLSAAQKG